MDPAHVLRVRALYKIVLRLHRGLPSEIQVLGNNYARDEFKRHKTCKKEEANIFLTEWTNYAIDLSKQLIVKGKDKESPKLGNNLEVDDLKLFKEDQIVQLYELSQAATGSSTEDETKGQKKEGNAEGNAKKS